MGFLADKTVFSPLTKEILEESISFSCGNEDLDGFFHNDAVSYADNLFGKSYCYYLEESKAVILALLYKYLNSTMEEGYVEQLYPKNPKHPGQKYMLLVGCKDTQKLLNNNRLIVKLYKL